MLLGAPPVNLWVEPCAGSFAVGLRLLGLPRLVGWMGSKAGYADAILRALHLQPKQGAHEVWIADTSDWSYCWEALAQPGVARRAADLIDEWRRTYGVSSPRQVRLLWNTLRIKWKAEKTPPDAEGAARWLVLVACSAMNRGPTTGFWHRDADQFKPGQGPIYPAIIKRLREWPAYSVPLYIWRDARKIPPARGIVLLDPPYSGTCGYGTDDLSREDVLTLANTWNAEGATVAVCEHELLPGWDGVDITNMRRGTAHSGKRKSEWLSIRGKTTN